MAKDRGFRNRKISIKQHLPVLRASELPDLDEEASTRNVPLVETGVDKEEEEEHHLQAAISAHQAAVVGAGVKQIYIPTPDASKTVSDYDKLYRAKYSEPSTYIRFSSTVEDCCGCLYNMDEEDEEWLTNLNSEKKIANEQCSEDAFELVMEQFENATNERQPYLAMDVSQIASYNDLEPTFDDTSAAPYKHFAKFIYEHWKRRRVASGGKPIQPVLRFEENDKDEGDPYVCFRRREVRQVRKTRRTDAQSTEKLRKLRLEMEQARNLVGMVARRERLRRESLLLEQAVFNQRCKVKDVKRKLGIKGDDEDLISHKKKKVQQEATAPTIRIPVAKTSTPTATTTTKSADADALTTLDEVARERMLAARAIIEEKLVKRRAANIGWEDVSDDPYFPLPKPYPLSFFRAVASSYYQSGTGEYNHTFGDSQSQRRRPAFRQRCGRGGRVWLDRRGLRASRDHVGGNRWKYDQEDSDQDDETVLEIDDMCDGSLRFRSCLLSEPDQRNLINHPVTDFQLYAQQQGTPQHRHPAQLLPSGSIPRGTPTPTPSHIALPQIPTPASLSVVQQPAPIHSVPMPVPVPAAAAAAAAVPVPVPQPVPQPIKREASAA
ncbi:hypothetical protein SAICODRAFT_4924 [Saitoella complicata NRRL Y-17804]|uniref:uncharacterized protein n=1 Tax=Saitoella complicata (strain BCRC 22490 / CBS 7301 / JCM 7358 / NBRC 10748 / NRRL Y-17804) TaxID=698492 RepID=UPI000866F458|nr:uncharacterized protein SAICODRAFT_4924 [Saitoella complicata NRRL Y-17804]ODQ55693.1 hypothetical protein SAICODRAFT_4924 [Saitoella complicata NRRL Y-17804]